MTSSRRFIVMIGLLLLVACSHPLKRGDTAYRQKALPEFIQSGWNFRLGSNVDEIKQFLGKPLLENVKPFKNRHTLGQIDEIYTLDYGGLMVDIYRVKEKVPRDLIIRLVITDKRFPLKSGLRVGSTRTEVVRLLGQPQEDGDQLTYSMETEAGPDSVTFSLSKGKIKKVEWTWYID